MAAREDDARDGELAHEGVGDVAGVDLAIHLRFAHATRDELGVLGAEVEYQDPLMLTRPGNWGPP